MTHFRGQIRGPHWGPTMDNMLIDFWRRHDCLFNSASDSYYDKELKTKLWSEFASSVGKSVSEVERRSRSLRTQYGRVVWHPERVSTPQQEMLREKLAFLKPYIVRRRAEIQAEENGRDEDNEEFETEGSIDQDMGSAFSSPLDADVTEQDLDDEPQVSNVSNPQPQVTGVMSLSCLHHPADAGSDATAGAINSKHDVLNHFAEVMLADMRHIQDPMVLMRLRRDITDLVFRAVEEDGQRRRVRAPSMLGPRPKENSQSWSGPPQMSSQSSYSWRFMRRKNGCEGGRGMQRWEEMKHMRRMSRSHSVQQTSEGLSQSRTQVHAQASEMKREAEPHVVKTEEETHPLF